MFRNRKVAGTDLLLTGFYGVEAFVALDWKGDRLIGLEILDASSRLHPDLLNEAEIIS